VGCSDRSSGVPFGAPFLLQEDNITTTTTPTTTVLRRHRKARRLTQPQLADLIGCGQPSVVNYEYGRTFPRDPRVRARLEALFGCPVADLMRPDNDERPAPTTGTDRLAQEDTAPTHHGARPDTSGRAATAEASGLGSQGTS
jgi:transcriptional regulator with XRE-family HTH domain